MSRIILVVGAGRCGLISFMGLLARQGGVSVSLEDTPLLPWKRASGDQVIRERFARFRRKRPAEVIVDTASFYLPYLADAIALEPDIRIVGLKRPRDEQVASFERFLDEYNTFPTNHWADDPVGGFSHEVLWTRTFPQYPIADRAECLRRYWDDYYQGLTELAQRHPQNVRIFDMHEVLNTAAVQAEALSFAGIPAERQTLRSGVRAHRVKPTPARPQAKRTLSRGKPTWGMNHPLDPARCAVLVPYIGSILPQCEAGLRELEKAGYQVRRVGGFSAIDQGRNQLATDALIDGFEETMWIDSDIEFEPASVDRLRSHNLPIVCGLYSQKRFRALTSKPLPGTDKISFGQTGGLVEFQYVAAGFLLVRREAYLKIQHQLALPLGNERFSSPIVPYFQPMMRPHDDGNWYLAEDYAFCERARQCGIKIIADTSIRLWHIGSYAYGWEESGSDRPRAASYTLHMTGKAPIQDT
jgi:hypothetical protein